MFNNIKDSPKQELFHPKCQMTPTAKQCKYVLQKRKTFRNTGLRTTGSKSIYKNTKYPLTAKAKQLSQVS